MKIMVLVLALATAFCGTSLAMSFDAADISWGDGDDQALSIIGTLEKIPNLKQGVIYSALDSKFKYAATMAFVTTKYITIEGGVVPADDELIGVVSYQILKLRDFGVTVPLLDLVEFNIGAYAGGMDLDDDPEFDAGASLTLINVKF